jgi:xanthine dehydrogenase YagR molybdenum-binding subunit
MLLAQDADLQLILFLRSARRLRNEFIAEHGPYVNAMGAKGTEKVSIVGVTAAMSNAVFHATGRRRRSLPITPDKVLEALRQPA